MRSYLKLVLILLCLIWQAGTEILLSQTSGYIVGKVLNSSTSVPVPFATVRLKTNQLGVFANAEGDFKISHNPQFQTDSLIITCIGFKQYSLPFKDLNIKSVNKIYLTPAIYQLGEVKVLAYQRKLGSVTIIGRAIRQIRNNYPRKPFSYISYYRDYQKRDSNYINLNEAIVQTLDKGFSSRSALNEYRLLDYRKNIDFPRMYISPYYDTIDLPYFNSFNKNIPYAKLGDQYGNELFILMVHDAIRNYKTRSFSFIDIFSENFLYNHDFSEPAKVFNNNLLLYKINFAGKYKLTGDSLIISGAIYIQPKDYSIHKLEYSCSYLTKGKEKRDMFNINIEYGYENSIDSSMYLKYISFNNIFEVQDMADSTYFRIKDSYWGPKFWEPSDLRKPTLIFDFNNKIDPESAARKENYKIMVGKKVAKITDTMVKDKKLIITIKDDNFQDLRDSSWVNIKNLKDINGNILNRRKILEFYQYRELFVQEYNKSLAFTDSCYLKYLPLEQNCISKYSGKEIYWMNTPENIKIKK
jgi:hypothetical protein